MPFGPIDECTVCTANCNAFSANDAGPVHAWDEGVAFYTGSLEGLAPGGTSSGKLAYRLAEKRCANFGTCTGTGSTSGISQVNHELFKAGGLFPKGRDLLHEGKCSEVRPVVNQIVSIMTVPLVQGTLRYAWKTGQIGGVDNKASDQSAKNSAEGSTFAAAVLPLVHACDADAAKTVSDHMKFGAAVYGKDNNFASGTIAGYNPMGGSVKEHNEIDLDQAAMETALGTADWTVAKAHYSVGGNSKTSSPYRTLQGFSTGAKSKMYDGTATNDDGSLKCPGCPYKHYKQFYDYYGAFTYADDWALAALDGTELTFAAPASLSFNFE